MRKLEKSDKFFIEKIRANHREELDVSVSSHEGVSTVDQSSYHQFHYQLLKHTRIRSLLICGSNIVPKSQKEKEHVVYELQVVTDELSFQVWRRFREFYAFYKKIKKHLPKDSVSPQKSYNLFSSSISQATVQERKINLNLFLQDVLQYIITSKDQKATFQLFNFLEIKEIYEERYIIHDQYQKTSSEKGQFNRYYSLKPNHSLRKLDTFHQNSLQMLIALINEPINPSKHLKKLEEVIRNKKFKATNQEIKIIFMGFEDYYGLLKFGLTNPLESNRLAALEILIDLLLPQRNLAFEKYEKVLEKVPLQLWKVSEISFLESPLFKVHYFRLLKIFCQKAQKDSHKGQIFIVKTLFMFHQDLVNDYLQWKNIHTKEHKIYDTTTLPKMFELDVSEKIEIANLKNLLEEIDTQRKEIKCYYHENKNVIVLKMESKLKLQEISEIGLKWNRFMREYKLEEYTGLYRYSVMHGNKSWRPRIKVEEKYLNNKGLTTRQQSSLLPEEVQSPLTPLLDNAQFKITKQQTPFQFYSELNEEIWVSPKKESLQLLIILKVTRDVNVFEGSLRPQIQNFAQDAYTSFVQ